MEKRTLAKGELSIENESVGNSSMFRGRSMNDGEQYEVDFGDGVRAVYRPWSEKNHYAQRGELEIIIDERPDAKSLDKALGNIEKLGLKTNIADAEDAEIMYLTKQAYVTKADREPEYARMISGLDGRNATKTERIQTMRGFWEQRLGVSDITRMPGYDPVGEYQLGFKDTKIAGGYRHQYRFDITDADLEKQMKGYSLYHRLTNGESVSEFLDTVIENNGAMISTVEKLRAGVMPGGMSPESDMNSGGASYVFTRIRKSPTASSGDAGLYFKKRLLRRMDAVSYNHDAFGKVKDDYVSSNRGSDPTTWKSFSCNSSNETIFKYSITLLDNLESIVVHSNVEKSKVLDVFKRHGISTLPDGRKVEELVVGR